MTLIECFTDSHIDNISACLRLRPDKVVMVGQADEMARPVDRYEQLLKQRRQRTEITTCDVRRKDIGDICQVLENLVREEGEYVIDLTGGDEPVIMAVGAVLAKMDPQKRKSIRVEKFDHARGVVLDCMNDNRTIPGKMVRLTVKEMIELHGGKLHPDSYQPPKDCGREELAGLWRIVSADPKHWNRAVALLNEFESRSESRMQVYLPFQCLRESISKYEEKEAIVLELLEQLQREGIIDNRSNQNALEYTYKSSLFRYCLQKAGNVLEVKTLLEGRAATEKGIPLFSDCQMSVSIDWDGKVHTFSERIPDTRNEIDVVLIHGTTPLFISCKNGNIGEEELYKLHTVAERFGGPYARKMLVATDLDRKSATANQAFIQRAWDMDILLVTDAAQLPADDWQELFRRAIQ